MDWSEDRIDLLKRLWARGQSASRIAEQLGGVTRNAVIGKAHRLGLSGRPSPIKREAAVKPAAAAARSRINGRACMWPVGDPKQPGFHFCGAPTESNRPYCASHCAVAYHRKTDAAA